VKPRRAPVRARSKNGQRQPSTTISIRCTPEQLAQWAANAERSDPPLPPSTWIRLTLDQGSPLTVRVTQTVTPKETP
jgi:hypothetical protein